MKQKKVPMRKCTGCGEMKEKKQLVRIVKAPEKDGTGGEISVDLTGKMPGRGAYICKNSLDCLAKAKQARRLERAFSCKIPDEIYEKLTEQMQSVTES